MAKRPGGGGGDTVLEGRHLLAVFFAIVVLSAVFFTLGYVLGRMQGEAKSASLGRRATEPQSTGKTAPAQAPQAGSPSDLSFYETVEKKNVDATLSTQPSAPPATAPTKEAAPKGAGPTSHAPAEARGITLQVAALLKREDAESMAEVLRHKKYPVMVLPPAGDQFFRVQVGPFASEQMAGQMRKRLENEGFKVITKR